MTYFQCLVPTTRHDTAVVWGFYPVDCPDWTFMLNKTKTKNIRITYLLYTHWVWFLYSQCKLPTV